ncbi:MAG: ABC transporter substrate-binding protein [Beijerinckiaceae bacterium]|nr:ABC transporter substrate-binding protein [Beijerinckiaceae bacterium]
MALFCRPNKRRKFSKSHRLNGPQGGKAMNDKVTAGGRFAALILSGIALSVSVNGAAAQQTLTVVSFGGSYQDGQSKALFQPAAKALGITLKEETYSGIADLRLKVKAGAVTWDIVASGSGSAARAGAEGILEKLDYKVIDTKDFLPQMATDYCVGGDVFSTVLAWNTKTFGENGPKSWADFWDVKKFPGKRSYRKGVAGALEPALMADGVPPNKVYEVLSSPGGIERAIKKVRELKPHVAVWWTSGAQHAQLMKDGEVDMITGWNGRFDVVAKDGAKVAYTFNQALLDYDCFAVPKGAPNKDLAMKFLAEISKPQYQAEFTKYITYGPTNKKAYDLGTIDAAYAKRLPSHPDNAAKQLTINLDWYIKFEAQAATAYENMLSE